MTNCDHSNGWREMPDKCGNEEAVPAPRITWHQTVYPPPPGYREFPENRFGLGPHLDEDEPLADWERGLLPFDNKVQSLYDHAAGVLLSKHHDYGPHNIGRSPGGPLNGLRVRMWDKIARLNNLVDKGEEAKHESLEDTLLDLANYALIGVLVLRGDWPDE